MKPTKKQLELGNYKAISVAIEKYGATKVDNNTVRINGSDIDLSASGHEDWQVAKNIIDQLL